MAKKLTSYASKPVLIRIELDDAETIARYEDSLEFWVYDRQPIETFAQLATVRGDNIGGMIQQIKALILDESGNPIMNNDLTLPSDLLLKAVNRVVEMLGK
jgi:hypothetical protein